MGHAPCRLVRLEPAHRPCGAGRDARRHRSSSIIIDRHRPSSTSFARLEHFPATWTPVRASKMRSRNDVQSGAVMPDRTRPRRRGRRRRPLAPADRDVLRRRYEAAEETVAALAAVATRPVRHDGSALDVVA